MLASSTRMYTTYLLSIHNLLNQIPLLCEPEMGVKRCCFVEIASYRGVHYKQISISIPNNKGVHFTHYCVI